MNTQNKKSVIDVDINLFENNGINPNTDGNYINNELSVITDTGSFQQFVQTNQPYKTNEARLFVVKSGDADYIFNFEDYQLTENSVVILPADTILTLKHYSKDFSANVTAFPDTYFQQLNFSFTDSATLFSVNNEIMSVTEQFFSLINLSINTNTGNNAYLKYLILSLLEFLLPLYNNELQQKNTKKQSRSEDILKRFLLLLKQTEGKQVRVNYFAEKLCIAPNHLSNVIKKTSSMTVMQYVNRSCVIQAKVLLKHSDMSVADIAQTLNFADTPSFSKFFKRHCNQTPSEYRNN